MIKLILLDIDGTMIHAKGAGGLAFGRAFGSMFNLPDGAKGLRFAGRTDLSLLHEFMGMHGILSSRALERDFFALYAHWLAEMLPQFEGNVFPGVRDLMASCRDHPEGPELGLLTGNTRLGAEIKLRHFDLWEDFLIGAYGDEDPSRPVLAGLAARRGQEHMRTPLQPDEILVIGDTPSDVACSQSIGATSLAVATGGFSIEALEQSGATRVVDSLEGLGLETLLSL